MRLPPKLMYQRANISMSIINDVLDCMDEKNIKID